MKEITNGFNLFPVNRKEIDKEISEFENYFGAILPPIYKVFCSTFEIGRNKMKSIEVYIDSANRNFNIGLLNYSGKYSDYIGLYEIFSLSESIEVHKIISGQENQIHGYIPIGECFDNNLLLLGVNNSETDKIYLENPNLFPNGERNVEISENIFSFVKELRMLEKDVIGYGIEGYNQLYRTWGEEFWRIK